LTTFEAGKIEFIEPLEVEEPEDVDEEENEDDDITFEVTDKDGKQQNLF
jgi:hypothetical protein